MPLLLFLLIFTFPLLGLQIEDRLEASTALKPTTYGVVIKVETRGGDEWSVLNTLSAVDNGVKALGIPYRGGYYNIVPVKVQDRRTGTLRVEGFKGTAEYTFLLDNPGDSRKIFDLFRNLKANYPLSYWVVSERWIVPRGEYEKAVEKLKNKLIERAKELASLYGKELGLHCGIKELRFNPLGGLHTFRVIAPVGEEKRVKLTARVLFECH